MANTSLHTVPKTRYTTRWWHDLYPVEPAILGSRVQSTWSQLLALLISPVYLYLANTRNHSINFKNIRKEKKRKTEIPRNGEIRQNCIFTDWALVVSSVCNRINSGLYIYPYTKGSKKYSRVDCSNYVKLINNEYILHKTSTNLLYKTLEIVLTLWYTDLKPEFWVNAKPFLLTTSWH